MAKLIYKVGDRHGLIYRGVLFLATVAVLILLFPQEAKFKYEYDSAKPWKYDDLYAPFEFAIQKSENQLTQERQELLDRVRPFYFRDDDITDQQSIDFRKALEANWDDCSYKAKDGLLNLGQRRKDSLALERHFTAGDKLLRKVFKTGIVQLDDAHEEKPEEYTLTLYYDRDAEEVELGELHSVQSAFKYLEKKVKKLKEVDEDFLLEHLSEVLTHNVFYDAAKTEQTRTSVVAKAKISLTRGKVERGEKIVGRGEIVTADVLQKLNSLKEEYQEKLGGSKNYFLILSGQVLLSILLILALFFFLNLFRKEILATPKKLLFILFLIVMMVGIGKICLNVSFFDIYIVPLCLLPIIIRAFYDTILALFVHVITTLILSFFAPNAYEFVFIHLIAGTLLVLSIGSLRKRAQFFFFVLIIFGSYALTYLGLAVIQEGSLDQIQWDTFAWLGGNAGLALLAYPLIYVFEKVFGFISEVTLMELSDTNNPLLRELTSLAPGTFQHTLQVANLAEDAIYEIGGNALLVRVGALYHDIGKMQKPMYFIENQTGVNPHDELAYDESARIIINHVLDGIELAKRYNLPDEIIDFIRTHHGTTRTEYFYRMKVKEMGDESLVNAEEFTYPGPLPYSKETAVLMMADSVEAASRSLKEYSVEAIDGLVEGIINHQMGLQQFANADITLKDITRIKKMFKRKLMNIYHVRVEYPK